ncbi:MAG: hypothetical protein PHF35_03075 [Candidatus Moranbacteria bacterium]|nr:hypothetical protein [Candidatus Moranbacteria bacterium]
MLEIYNSISKNDPEIKKIRSKTVSEILSVRKLRNEKRKEAGKLINKVKSVIGVEGGSTDLNKEADELNEESKEILKSNKGHISDLTYKLQQEREKSKQEEIFNKNYSELEDAIGSFFKSKSYPGWPNDIPPEIVNGITSKKKIIESALHNERYISKTLFNLIKLAKFRNGEVPLFAASCLNDELELIKEKIKTKDGALNGGPVAAIKFMIEYGSEEQRANGVEAVQNYLDCDAIENGLNHEYTSTRYVSDESANTVGTSKISMELVLNHGTDLQKAQIEEMVRKNLNDTFFRNDLLGYLCSSRNKNSEKLGRLFVKEIVEVYGLNFDNIYKSWKSDFGNVESNVPYNIQAIAKLEKIKPGITKVLNEEFGIKFFDRYPVEMLIEQYENRDNLEIPYGIIILPEADHNYSFARNEYLINNIRKQLGDEYTIRATECRSVHDVVRSLIKFNKRYNPNDEEERKISFAIIGGHGETDSISFGYLYGGNLKKSYLTGTGLTKLGGYFKKDCTIILDSCSTGAPNGIAHFLSEKIGVRVIAPDTDSGPTRINAKIINGKPEFEVAFRGARTKEYLSGKDIDNS